VSDLSHQEVRGEYEEARSRETELQRLNAAQQRPTQSAIELKAAQTPLLRLNGEG
jgi:hypothetical protein